MSRQQMEVINLFPCVSFFSFFALQKGRRQGNVGCQGGYYLGEKNHLEVTPRRLGGQVCGQADGDLLISPEEG